MAKTYERITLTKAYKEAFDFLNAALTSFNIDTTNLTNLEAGGVIDAEVKFALLNLTHAERAERVYQELINKNEIEIYNNYIKFCDINNTNLAKIIREKLEKCLRSYGLSQHMPSQTTGVAMETTFKADIPYAEGLEDANSPQSKSLRSQFVKLLISAFTSCFGRRFVKVENILFKKGSVIVVVIFLVTPGEPLKLADDDKTFENVFAADGISISHPSIYTMAGEYGSGAKSKITTLTPFSGTPHSLRESSPANDQPSNDQTDGKEESKASLALRLVYHNMFEENKQFIMENIDFQDGNLWIEKLKIDCISKDCEEKITKALKMQAKVKVVVEYLKQQDDIKKYKRFISVWKEIHKATGEQFEGNLADRIKCAGLTSENA